MPTDYVGADRFYQDAGDKVKMNWLCYEYANNLFMEIRSDGGLKQYREKHSAGEIATFCVYFTKRLRKSVFDSQLGHTKGVSIRESYICEFYPDIDEKQMRRLLESAGKAWREQVSGCAVCPNRCLTDGWARTDMFDRLKKTGWPT